MEDKKTNFGLNQIAEKTPEWAKWLFRITFLVTTALSVWIASTNLITPSVKYELTLILKVIVDPVVFGISKMFGINNNKDI